MSTFNQGIPGVPTLINSSQVLLTGNAASANALTVRQFGTGNVFSAQTTSGTTVLFVGANGNVGIGTTSPVAPLDVVGTVTATSLVGTMYGALAGSNTVSASTVTATSLYGTLAGSNTVAASTVTATSLVGTMYGALAGSNTVAASTVTATSLYGALAGSNTVSASTVTATSLYGTLAGSNTVAASTVSATSLVGTMYGALAGSNTVAASTVTATSLYGALAGSNTVAATSATFSATPAADANVLTVIGSSTTGNVVQFSNTAGGNFIMTSAGNVGIGKTNPVAPLDVAGTVITSGQVQSLDSLRAHSLPSDAMIVASSTLVTPTNQNPGSYALVESANALTLTTTGSVPVVTQSPFADLYKEGSVYFNGTVGNYITTTATGYIGTAWGTAGMTIEAWVNYPTFTNAALASGGSPVSVQIPTLFGCVQPAGASASIAFGSNVTGYTTFFYNANAGGLQSVTAQTPLSANTWNHIAITCSTSSQIFLFVNGVQSQIVANRNGTLQTAAYFETIQSSGGGASGNNPAIGQFNSTPVTAYLADLRITTGTPVYTGSTSSFATFTVPSAPLSTAATGVTQALIRAGQNSPTVQNGALTFDRGLKQYMNFGPQTFNLVTQGFTVIWRGQMTGTPGNYETIFQGGFVNSTNGWFALIRSTTSSSFYFALASSTTAGQVGSTGLFTLNQNTPYVVAARYNPVTQIVDAWVNGITVSSVSLTTASLIGDRTVSGYLGYGYGSFTSMTSNTLAIYNRALSNVEILNAYSALTTTPATPLQKTLEIGDINGTPALSVAGNGQVFMDSIGLSSNVVPWPPAAMTGYDTVINGGVYKARASSENSGLSGIAWYAFDKNSTGTFWISAASYGSTAPYASTASTTTDVNGTAYLGEWLQIQQPSSVTLSSYSISPGTNAATGQAPAKWAILGSRDGVNWTLVDARAGVTTWAATTAQTFSAPASQAWTYFRCVVTQVNGYVGANPVVVFGELILYGTADASPTLTIAPATTFNTSVATPSLTGIAAAGVYAPQDFSTSGLNIPAYVVSNTATVANTVAFSSFGPFAGEGSLYFPGGFGAYVNFPSSAVTLWPGALTSLGSGTIELWVYLTKYNTNQTTLIARGTSSGTFGWWLNISSSGVLTFQTYGGGFTTSGGTVSLNAWNHLAVSSASNYVSIFLNGTLVGTPFTYSGTLTGSASDPIFISNPSNANYTINGYITGLRLTQGLALYTTSFTPPTQSLQPIQGTTQAGLPYGTVLLLRNAPAPGRIQTTKFSGANSVGTNGAPAVLSFPPAAMTGYATALSSGYGQGTYVASASSEYATPAAGYPAAWYAFDKNSTSTYWVGSQFVYNASIPYNYTGSVRTVDVNGNSYAGDWLQIQLPSSIVLSSYSFVNAGSAVSGPGAWGVLGSLDGINWFLVDKRSSIAYSSSLLSYSVSSSQAFTYFRVVFSNATGGGTLVQIAEWTYNGSIESVNVTADGRVGLGVVNPVQALEVAGSAIVAGTLSAGNPLMFRNRIINGDFRIDQRNAGASFTLTTPAAKTYTLDRWWGWCRLASKFSVQQTSVVPLGLGFKNSVLVTSLSAYTTVASDYYGFGQYIEGYNIADLNWGTSYGTPVTLSFWVRASIAGNYSVSLEGASFLPSYIIQYTVSAVDTWQQIVSTVQPPTNGYTANFPSTTAASLRLWWDLGSSDATYGGAAGVWVAADKLRVTGSVSLLATNAATLYIAGVQLEKGTVATPFEVRPFAIELALCQRYYQKSYSIETTPGTATEVGNWSNYLPYAVGNGNNWIQSGPTLQVSMRGTPTIVFYGSSGAVNTTWNALAGSSASTWRYLNNTSGVTQNAGVFGLGWTATTEL